MHGASSNPQERDPLHCPSSIEQEAALGEGVGRQSKHTVATIEVHPLAKFHCQWPFVAPAARLKTMSSGLEMPVYMPMRTRMPWNTATCPFLQEPCKNRREGGSCNRKHSTRAST